MPLAVRAPELAGVSRGGLLEGIEDDAQRKNTEGLTSKSLALGEVYEAEGKTKLAVDAAQGALKAGSVETLGMRNNSNSLSMAASCDLSRALRTAGR